MLPALFLNRKFYFMYNTSGNVIPERFVGRVNGFNGSNMKVVVPPSVNTELRALAEQNIRSYGTANLDSSVTDVFVTHIPECRAYVIAKGETPQSDPIKLGMQVCILRAQDIANQGKALDITDEDSLQEIESTEAGLQDINSPDMYSALSMPTQAAVKIVLDQLSTLHEAAGGTGKMIDALYFLKTPVPPSTKAPVNSFDGMGADSNTDAYMNMFDLSDFLGTGNTSDVTSNNLSSTGFAPGDPNGDLDAYLNGQSTASLGSEGSATKSVSGSSNASGGGGVLTFLTGLFSNATKLATSVTQAANSTAGAAGAVKNAVSNVGANSIATYINNNKGTIILVVVIILALVLTIIYAAKRKH